ncbi:MAG TPA: hypothetical protein VGM19_09495 [Armatimonadota bacterium]|jgi:hypothetical protein
MKLGRLWAVMFLALTGAAWAAELPTPAPPTAAVVGAAGTRTVCYWVFAESAEPAPTAGSWYLKAMPGKVTSLSQPCVVKNAPDTLSAANKVVLTIIPVAGAVRYHILKTEELSPPNVTASAQNPGATTLYYWVQGHNGWRSSPLVGPIPLKCDLATFSNSLSISPTSSSQWKQSAWVTTTPEPPVGRKPQVLGLLTPQTFLGAAKFPYVMGHNATWAKENKLLAAWGPPPYPVTAATEVPFGTGKYLLASVAADSLTVEDIGQDLQMTQPPTVNETTTQDFAARLGQPQSSRSVHQGAILSSNFTGGSAMENDFYAGYCPFDLNVVAERGGINYYWPQPAGYPGYKSTMRVANFALTSYTESQHSALDVTLSTYGTGDAITQGANLELHAGNRDAGDEGGELMRTFITRFLDQGQTKVDQDAPVGARVIKANVGATGISGGTGRTIVNLTQAYSGGRIDHVENVDIFGAGTQWTPAMLGWLMSFDVDNVKDKRSWFQVTEVVSPTHLKLMMYTTWRPDMNLGYSRFIYNAAAGQKLPSLAAEGLTYGGPEVWTNPKTLYTNPMAIGVLPKALEPAAAAGKYLLAPGASLADPWQQDGGFHVEPLAQAWKTGDTVVLTPGTSQPMTGWWGNYVGELGPNDYMTSINALGGFQRPVNGPAFKAAGFGIGMRIDLPDERQGNGVIVLGEPVDGAFLGAPEVPLLRCYSSQIPFVQGSQARTALEIVAPTGESLLSVSKEGVTVAGALRGSAATRGEARFSGDAKRTSFVVTFAKPLGVKPVVVLNANQFARCRLAAVATTGFTVEFETAPPAGQDNVTIWWMAQE